VSSSSRDCVSPSVRFSAVHSICLSIGTVKLYCILIVGLETITAGRYMSSVFLSACMYRGGAEQFHVFHVRSLVTCSTPTGTFPSVLYSNCHSYNVSTCTVHGIIVCVHTIGACVILQCYCLSGVLLAFVFFDEGAVMVI